jgi:Fe2+ transport system protein FeoA
MSEPLFLPGTRCLIQRLGNNPQTSQRLSEMGILPGNHLEVARTSPLGTTLEVRLDQGETLALRREELEQLGCRFTALLLPLAAGRFPSSLRIRALLGGRSFRRRMEAQRLLPGHGLELLEQAPRRIRVRPEGSAEPVELGAGEAVKIIVEPLSEKCP